MDLKLKDSFQSLQQPLRVFKLSLVKIVLIYWDQVSSIFSWINLLIYVDSSLLTLRERNKNLKKFNKPQVVWLMPIAVSAITLTSCNTNQDKQTIALSQGASPGLTSDSGPPQFTTGVGCYKESRRELRVSWRRTWKLHRTVEPMRWSAFWGSFSKTFIIEKNQEISHRWC